MDAIIPQNHHSVEPIWTKELANSFTRPEELLEYLNISLCEENASVPNKRNMARKAFAQRVPKGFADKMEKGNLKDPLLQQVLPIAKELEVVAGFSSDPLEEQGDNINAVPSLLHKYPNRALLLLKGGCAINCRYCFRRHFPYQDNKGNKANWQQALEYVKNTPQINELVLSGGDPLMAKDKELAWLIQAIENIPHIKRVRIHSRLIAVLPSRVTEELLHMMENSRLKFIVVTHINHPNEIDEALAEAMHKLVKIGVTLLNQSVLLKGVNNQTQTLALLSDKLFSIGIMPYYLHVLDKVQGAAHFYVSDEEAQHIMQQLLGLVSGYLVPTLAREEAGKNSKTPLNLF